MLSNRARDIRSELQKEVIDNSITLKKERKDWEDHAKTLPVADGIRVQERNFNGVLCLLLCTQAPVENGTILYAHGGGLVTGSAETHLQFGSHLARATKCRVVLIDYGLLPEHAFETPRDDIISVYKYLMEEIWFQPERVVFAGDSSGAGAALAAMTKLRDMGQGLPRGFVSISGAFDVSLSGDTMTSLNGHDPILSVDVLRHWQETYFEGKISLNNPVISPLFSQLNDLPPMLLIAGAHEVWLSDSQRLAERVNKMGGTANVSIYDEMWHCFPMHVDLPETQDALDAIASFVEL